MGTIHWIVGSKRPAHQTGFIAANWYRNATRKNDSFSLAVNWANKMEQSVEKSSRANDICGMAGDLQLDLAG